MEFFDMKECYDIESESFNSCRLAEIEDIGLNLQQFKLLSIPWMICGDFNVTKIKRIILPEN